MHDFNKIMCPCYHDQLCFLEGGGTIEWIPARGGPKGVYMLIQRISLRKLGSLAFFLLLLYVYVMQCHGRQSRAIRMIFQWWPRRAAQHHSKNSKLPLMLFNIIVWLVNKPWCLPLHCSSVCLFFCWGNLCISFSEWEMSENLYYMSTVHKLIS